MKKTESSSLASSNSEEAKRAEMWRKSEQYKKTHAVRISCAACTGSRTVTEQYYHKYSGIYYDAETYASSTHKCRPAKSAL